MFEKTLTDIVKGIRASKRDTALYISQCISEIKTEINSNDMYVKANALQKLTFLQMMGYSMSWASFATIEVMSSPRFAHKRIGYLAASQGFTQDTEVILLTTNLLKKELRGAVGGGMNGVYEAGLAINCISNIVTEDLARDLLPEITNLTTHPQPYLRKKAILCLFKVFVKYPQGLRLTFAKLQKCLEDTNSSVVSCAVNVITELSDKNPKNYLHLAPAFFELLSKSSNNWMLIKVVKLLGSLVAEEPRLARKLLEPLATIVRNTQAKSLLFEAVHTITLCLPYCRKSDGSMPAVVPEIVTLCAQTLRSFVEEADQNLKYLGLVGFGSLMKSHPRVLSAPDYRPLILVCLSDQDVTIRTRALDLLTGMATRKNLVELVSQLLKHVEQASGSYKHDLVAKIIDMASGDKYALLQDFAWYLDVLFQLGHMRGVESHGDLLRSQITDVALRVLPVRVYAVRRSLEILLERESGGVTGDLIFGDNGRGKHTMPEILPALAWIIGEYSDLIREALSIRDKDGNSEFAYDDSSKGNYHAIVQELTNAANTENLATDTQKVYVQAAIKVFAAASSDGSCSKSELEAIVRTICTNLAVYAQSTDAEVVERSFGVLQLLKCLNLNATNLPGLMSISDEDSEDKDSEDLLGMEKAEKEPVSTGSLGSRIRESAGVLNHLFKPSPMKPVGAKAQRKKRNSPNGVTVDLDAPADLSVFGSLISEEEQYRSGSRLTLEAVSFTQQRPLRVEEASFPAASSGPPLEISTQYISSEDVVNAPSLSFQNQPGGMTNTSAGHRHGDPFYLDSKPSNEVRANNDHEDRRFGTIQLLDSDEEGDAEDRKRRKKKDRKMKKSRASQRDRSSENFMSFADSTSSAKPTMTVYESDDDEDHALEPPGGKADRQGPGKEFAQLAKVDLTTPLREDEVMPERKHRVVPERPGGHPKALKTKKKSKKTKKKKSFSGAPSETTGDLLDLGGFAPNPQASTPADPNTAVSSSPSVNLANAAFDDLLGLANPEPPALSQASMASPTTKPSPFAGMTDFSPAVEPSSAPGDNAPWMRAALKLANASGFSNADWSSVLLLYRTCRTTPGAGMSVSVEVRLDNGSHSALSGLTIGLKGHGKVDLGTVAAGSSSGSRRVGTWAYSSADSSQDCRGTLTSDGCSIPLKISLPATIHLNPQGNLTMEDVAAELGAREWSSHAAKMEITSSLSASEVKEVLASFLHAHEVVHGSSGPLVGTFASSSASSGALVRVLAKIKDRKSVKVDIRCTSSLLGKAIAADMKRLVL